MSTETKPPAGERETPEQVAAWCDEAARLIVEAIDESVTLVIDYTSGDWRDKIAAIIAIHASSLTAERDELKRKVTGSDGHCCDGQFQKQIDEHFMQSLGCVRDRTGSNEWTWRNDRAEAAERENARLQAEVEKNVDFHCHKCGKETATAPKLPEKAVCEECCEDHDYRYVQGERRHACIHCDKNAPPDWYDD